MTARSSWKIIGGGDAGARALLSKIVGGTGEPFYQDLPRGRFELSMHTVEYNSTPQPGPKGRGGFLAMALSYSLGVFNDNFFKQAASLLAVGASLPKLQGVAVAVYTLPWLLLAEPAGWLADRFPKKRVVIAAKCFEVAAMGVGALGICTTHWALMITMVGMMGVHSTFFSPALNGSIPEFYPPQRVLKANSILKMTTTTAILLGIIFSGLALGQKELWHGVPVGQVIVACAVLVVAALGLVSSFFIPHRAAAAPHAPFPRVGPAQTVRVLWAARRTDGLLSHMIWVDAYVWFAAALQVVLINRLGMTQLGLGETVTSYLVVAELAGVAVGGLACSRLAAGRWFRVLAPGAFLLGAAMLLMMAVPLAAGRGADLERVQTLAALVLLLAAGLGGGVMLVPLESFIQTRPAAGEKGKMIAAANFAAFTGILVAGITFVILDAIAPPSVGFGLLGAATIGVGIWLTVHPPRTELEDRA